MKYINFRYKYALVLVLLMSTLIMQNSASQSSLSTGQEQDREIKVLLLYGPDYLEGQSLDNEFGLNYATYGNTKFVIDRISVDSTLISSELLNESQADVLYLVNLHERILLEDEQNAIIAYVSEGHGIVGTHETLNPGQARMAPLFGINPEMISNGAMSVFPTSAVMNFNKSAHPLLLNMPDPYFLVATMTAALDGQQSPWIDDPRILTENGSLLVTSTDGNNAIIYAEGEKTRSVYLTHNPSESVMSGDLMLLYNSLSWTTSSYNNQDIYDSIEIQVESLIDGKDELMIQENKIWYNHLAYQKPGLFNGEEVPTIINKYEWFPNFPLNNDDPQESVPLIDIINIPRSEVTFKLSDIVITDYDTSEDPVIERTELLVSISQQPLLTNDFTLIITINDEDPNGAAWYSFTIYHLAPVSMTDNSDAIDPENDPDTTTIVYETVTVTNDSEAGPSIEPIFSDLPIKFDSVFLTLFIIGLIYSNNRSRRS